MRRELTEVMVRTRRSPRLGKGKITLFKTGVTGWSKRKVVNGDDAQSPERALHWSDCGRMFRSRCVGLKKEDIIYG